MNPIGELILVLDAGTTSTRAMVFDRRGTLRAVAQRELTQHYPQPGWVEHNAAEIWDATLACARDVVIQSGGADRIACLGITNQRETVVAWDKVTAEPLHHALVWQDRRTTDMCAVLKEAGHEAHVQKATGLLLDPYFSASKMCWLLDTVPEVRSAASAGRLAFGSVESWLAFKLTGGAHITDASNASRTSLLALAGSSWDTGLCDLFGVPMSTLAQIVDNAGDYGRTRADLFGMPIAITGLIGDQQSATIGQGCISPGDTKATYGTGAFVLTNQGTAIPHSKNRLLGTILYQVNGARHYALEGSVFVAGSLIKWLRDSMGLITSAAESEVLANSVADSGGVVVVPALAGLGAPHWRPEARGLIRGMSFASTRAHIVRACLEAMAMQTADLAEAFAGDGAAWTSLRIDGGMSANDWMAQDLANILALPVDRPAFVETTALGAAILAGVGAGMFGSLNEAVQGMRGDLRQFIPEMSENLRKIRYTNWKQALANV